MNYLIFVFVVVVLGLSDANAATRYSSPSGSGSTCSTGTPCSLTTGLSQTTSGDTLLLKNGTFTSVNLTNPLLSGTSGSPTTLACENIRQCTLQVTSGSGSPIITITAARSYLTFSGIVFDKSVGSTGTGAAFTISDTPTVSNIIVENSEFFATTSPTVRGGLYIGGLTTNSTFRGNYLHDFASHGFYIQGDSNIVEHNHIKNLVPFTSGNNAMCTQFYSENVNKPNNNIFRYNFCNTGNGSIRAGSEGLYIGSSSGNTAHNNIITNAVVGAYIRSSSTKFLNNSIYSVTTGLNVSAGTGCEIKNNALPGESLGTADADCSYSKNIATNGDISTSVTPAQLWIDPANNNFSLIESSAGIDTGATVSISGVTSVGAGYDVGALEASVRSSSVVENATPTIYSTMFSLPTQSTRNGIGLQTCTVGNFAVVVAGAGATESSCAISGTSRVDITLGAAVTNGQSLTDAMTRTAAPSLMDNVAIGDYNGTLNTHYFNAYVRTYTATAGVNNVGGGAVPSLVQTRFRFHHLRGTEAVPRLICTICVENYSMELPRGAAFRLRVKFRTDDDPASTTYKLRASVDGGADADIPDTMDTAYIAWYGASGGSDIPDAGTPTTELLTSDEAANTACAVVRTSSDFPLVDLGNSETECEYVLQTSLSAPLGRTWDFRVYRSDNTALDAYTVTPRLTAGAFVFGF